MAIVIPEPPEDALGAAAPGWLAILVFVKKLSPSSPGHLSLKRPDGVLVFFSKVIFDVLTEHDDGVVVLFHATQGALDTILEMGHDAPGMENVSTTEFLVVAFRQLKTHSTCVGKVCTALPVLYRLLFALGPVLSH